MLPYEPKATTSCKLTPSINEYRLHEETSLVWNEMQFHFDNLKVWSHGGVVIGSYGFRSQGLHCIASLDEKLPPRSLSQPRCING